MTTHAADSASASAANRLAWWQHARFGMFIHWGLYTVGDVDCWAMHNLGTPVKKYVERLEPRFTARRFDADVLAGIAKRGGARYVVMGTRHHEGYCLWNTDTTGFSSAKLTPRRDFIGEYTKAVRAAGLKVGVYYSLLDWRCRAYWDGPRKDPAAWAAFVEYIHAQVREIVTRYGRIDILWFDGHWAPTQQLWGFQPTEAELADAWRSHDLLAMVRQHQPHILINNRAALPADFGTPEKLLVPESRPWEMCDTMGHWWGASTRDLNRRTPLQLVSELIDCVKFGGNFLLNIGPRADGSPQPWQRRNMERIGDWLAKHGEAIYGCGAEWQQPFNEGLAPWATTRRGNRLYMHLLRYPGPEFSVANLHDYHLISAKLLDTGKTLKLRHEPTRDVITGLPARKPDPIAPVVELRIRPRTLAEAARRQLIGVADPEAECRLAAAK